MITVQPTTKKEISEFNTSEWHGVDQEHYGKEVEWDEAGFAYKVTEDGQIVGSITGKHESGVLYIDDIIVANTKRGLGVGKKLMEEAEKFGKEHGAHKAHLITGKDWEARKFYDSLGYIKVAELPNHHFHKDFVIYEKIIS